MSMIQMKKMTLLLTKKDVDRVIDKLMFLKCVDVRKTDIKAHEGLEYFPEDEKVPELNSRLGVVTSAIDNLKAVSEGEKSLFPRQKAVDLTAFAHSEEYAKTYETALEVNRISDEIAALDEKIKGLEETLALLKPWESYALNLSLTATETVKIALGSFPGGVTDEKLAGLESNGGVAMDINSVGGSRYMIIFYHKSFELEVMATLVKLRFNRAGFLPKEGFVAEKIKETEREIRESAAVREEELKSLKALCPEIANLEILSDAIKTKLNGAAAKSKMLRLGSCGLLTAWVPVTESAKVENCLSKYECAFEFTDPEERDEPPVLLKNNAFAKNFEWVLGMYSYPKYGTYDPSFVMGIFYCLIFGMMFADVGYGVIMMLVCFLGVALLKPKESMKRFLLMFGWCGVGTTLMGVLFGGYFGDMPQQIMTNLLGAESAPSLAIVADPTQDPMKLLVISLATGGVHLISGMALRMYITWRDGHPLDAVLDTVPWWILFAGIGLWATVPEVGKWVTAAGAVAMILTQGRKNKNIFSKLGGGIFSLYGIVNFVSDIVSYSRIMALGLASAVVAQVVNILGTMVGGSVVGTFFMIVIFIVGHALNMAINILGSFVHTSRLHYIEFFGRFFEEGGTEFSPMSPSEQYIVDNSTVQN